MAFVANKSTFLGAQVRITPMTIAPRRVPTFTPIIEAAYKGKMRKMGPGRHWEHYELTKNGKAVRIKMHVKSGDTIQVITGKDKGKVATISKVDPKTGNIICEGVNLKTKHVKPRSEEEKGQIKTIEGPIHHSNVMLYSKEQQVRSRVGHKLVEVPGKSDPVKVRFLIKTGEVIDAVPT